MSMQEMEEKAAVFELDQRWHTTMSAPGTVNSYPVLASMKVSTGAGEVPDQWVVICAYENEAYVVWNVGINEAGNVMADTGFYTDLHEWAVREWAQRYGRRTIVQK